ncbi:MAG TPA: isochorismatase family cysteine hydrolase [Candidatus Binatia bacterium]|jgi:ureidoacrylate peracid hydrolase
MPSANCLLIIDMQNELLHPEGKLYHGGFPSEFASLVPKVRELLASARVKAVPVIFVYTAYHPSFVDASPLSPSRKSGSLVEGSWGVKIIEEIAPRESEVVIRKRRPSAFFETSLDSTLRGLGAQALFLCGAATNRSVESTARDGFNRDYEVFVVADGTAARSVAAHKASLESLGGFFGKVVSTAEIEKIWQREGKSQK